MIKTPGLCRETALARGPSGKLGASSQLHSSHADPCSLLPTCPTDTSRWRMMLHLTALTTEKEAQCLVGPSGLGRQCVSHLGVLLWPIHAVP